MRDLILKCWNSKPEDKTTTDSKVKSDIGDGTPNTVVMREIL